VLEFARPQFDKPQYELIYKEVYPLLFKIIYNFKLHEQLYADFLNFHTSSSLVEDLLLGFTSFLHTINMYKKSKRELAEYIKQKDISDFFTEYIQFLSAVSPLQAFSPMLTYRLM